MMNINNYGIVTGRLSQDVTFFTNRDGSRKARFTVASTNAYKNADGTRSAQFVPLEAFIPADSKSSIYDLLAKGMLVSVQYTVLNNNYTDRDGTPHYDLVLQSETVRLQESKAVTDARRAQAENAGET